MHGNVWEWVEDCWHERYDDAPSDGSAWTTAEHCSTRVIRGGSWTNVPGNIRSATRAAYAADDRYGSNVGFRVARTLDR